jgi:hypothetical protein
MIPGWGDLTSCRGDLAVARWHLVHNIQFTNPNVSGGGLSIMCAPTGTISFSNMYLNSMLRSRYDENAIYKCFEDDFGQNSNYACASSPSAAEPRPPNPPVHAPPHSLALIRLAGVPTGI